ncbi:MAG: hypothetical protein K940chlam3_00966 [Chlamydiae bacterium]|nr:hypothetical protein [Chlamydiota bacterium]
MIKEASQVNIDDVDIANLLYHTEPLVKELFDKHIFAWTHGSSMENLSLKDTEFIHKNFLSACDSATLDIARIVGNILISGSPQAKAYFLCLKFHKETPNVINLCNDLLESKPRAIEATAEIGRIILRENGIEEGS